MAASGDPLGVGLVASLAHPGRNITGLSTYRTELAVNRVELMKELVAGISRVALLSNMSNPLIPPEWEETKRASRAFGLVADLLDVHNDADISRAFETALIGHVDAIIVGLDAVTQAHCQLIVDLAARNRLPAVYSSREFVEAGGLITYGSSYPQRYFRAATLVDKILTVREQSRETYPWSNRPSLNWSSISKPPRSLVSPSRHPSWSAPMR
jgi:putative ABC transport system substrate-binding protein